jgi:hypothetical protein
MVLVWLMLWFCAFTTSDDPVATAPSLRLIVDGNLLQEDRYSIVAMPGETLTLRLADGGEDASWVFEGGSPARASGSSVVWTAPRSHGVLSMDVETADASCAFSVILPVDSRRWRTESLNSFPIGSYGDGNDRSALPSHFVELTAGNSGTRLSTHMSLGEFLGHIEGAYPQYMALDMRLIDKIETGLRMMSEEHLCPLDVAIISGFRTPVYNRRIGNETDRSLHLYGGAADIWVESFPPNGLMDDVDRNKRVDVFDGEFVVETFRTAEALGLCSVGGISAYRWTSTHGPFVHVDVRGSQASWSTQRSLVANPII